MIFRTGNKQPRSVDRPRPLGFTLIELILVMTLLLVVFGLSIPTLSRFFKGRTLDSEARRFVSLTRYAQSRAVSEGAPVRIWVDREEGRYGVERESSYGRVDAKAVEYEIDPELTLETVASREPVSRSRQGGSRGNLPDIRFQPDGSIRREGIEMLVLRLEDDETDAIWIGPSRSWLSYEIQTNTFQRLAR